MERILQSRFERAKAERNPGMLPDFLGSFFVFQRVRAKLCMISEHHMRRTAHPAVNDRTGLYNRG
ncbi:hypothetical protein A6764_20430 [Brevibacillus sp. WF146]|uniref:hypothetical protein n=1 Tax=Brevibacillus sp. WF146 TaxID=319501 RepID=UPI000A972845|nr:hypothetical protein [Brevibacillus sp. WF146]UYZ13121.1 hypothetical protein A6764_20430 [Brevibacillus sp. WF146]